MFALFGIIFLLAALLTCPLVLDASFIGESGLTLKLRYLRIPILSIPSGKEQETPSSPKKEKKGGEEQEDGDKSSLVRGILQKKGLSGFLELLRELAGILCGTAGKILSHTTIPRLWLNVAVTADDPADIAVRYGQACSVIFPVVNLLASKSKCRSCMVNVMPGFDPNQSKSSVDFSMKVRIRPCFILSALLAAAFRLFRMAVKAGIFKKEGKDDQNLNNKAVQSK